MQTANFITASAEITSITKLKKGDVYKRLTEADYAGGVDKITHGIVLDVLYNGTDAAIQTMEFQSDYNGLKTEFKVFGGGKDIKIFPSSQEEVEKYLKGCVDAIKRDIETQEKKLIETKEKLTETIRITSGELVKRLTTPDYADTVLVMKSQSTNEEVAPF